MTRKNVIVCDGCTKIINPDKEDWVNIIYSFKPATKYENAQITVDFCEHCALNHRINLKGVELK